LNDISTLAQWVFWAIWVFFPGHCKSHLFCPWFLLKILNAHLNDCSVCDKLC
jgi:hypothetical protein